MQTAVKRLLGNTPLTQFTNDFWGKDCLLVTADESRYAELFSWTALQTILSTQRFDFPRLRLVRRGKVVPPAGYITLGSDRRGNVYTTHRSDVVASEMKQGAMLHITSLQETWEPLARFAAELEPQLTARVQINLHAALAESRGFATHWDGHDVFVMQIAGKKRWRLFGMTEAAPIAVPPDQKRDPPSAQIREIVLQAGDMLYVPRGYWHAAEALEDVSLHLTCAAQYPTGLDFLGWIMKRLESRPTARKDIPFHQIESAVDADEHRANYAAVLSALISEEVSPTTLQQYLQEYQAGLGRTNRFDLS
ncbi:MAG: hypothetical protein CTY31_09380 [Hyphomicrobium sp.]|jgi:hypothetical protein|nr:MAG: hypothetical protein CTY39_08745 [Hyphomicrobium sp.]PPD00089.1 MAG: hypothetical protein CTY31_09380 [Hyphomicrobium sp.]